MTWYKHPGWRTAGIAILALAAAQTVQVILFVAISAALQSSGSQAGGWLNAAVMLPAVVSALAGGAFLGRLRPAGQMGLWIATSAISGLLPVVLQLVSYPESLHLLTEPSIWLSMAGAAILWFAGCWLGSMTHRRNPDPNLDRQLLQWTGGAVGVVVVLYAMTWGSILFSKGYRLAKQVELIVPPGVEEIEVPYREPGIAQIKGFKTTIPAGNREIQDYYIASMRDAQWSDVSGQFQNWEPGNWQIRTETWDNETVEYRLDGAHWLDLSGKVAVTLVVQAVRTDPATDWQTGSWTVQGLILSRPYAEPENPPEPADEIPAAAREIPDTPVSETDAPNEAFEPGENEQESPIATGDSGS